MTGRPAAKQGDKVVALDTHLIQPPGTSPPVPVPHPFSGTLDQSLSTNVKVMGMAAATVGSVATNTPPHVPIGGTFVNPPKNRGEITQGSTSVKVNGKAMARAGDPARTCNDPVDQDVGTVVAVGTVLAGG
jgi:uncharacterized Zn-binding protein involved in type VI secretion